MRHRQANTIKSPPSAVSFTKYGTLPFICTYYTIFSKWLLTFATRSAWRLSRHSRSIHLVYLPFCLESRYNILTIFSLITDTPPSPYFDSCLLPCSVTRTRERQTHTKMPVEDFCRTAAIYLCPPPAAPHCIRALPVSSRWH